MSKLFERLINVRLRHWIEFNNILPISQAGFRTGRCCIDNLANLVTDIKDGFLWGKVTLGASLDVKGAFDNVLPHHLSNILERKGCSSRINNFMQFIMRSRSIVCRS